MNANNSKLLNKEIHDRMENMTYCRKVKIVVEESDPSFPVTKVVPIDDDVINLIRQFYEDDIEIHQSCFAIFCDSHDYTLGYAKIGQGGEAGFETDPLIIAKIAVDLMASCVLVVHNHITDDLTITKEEIALTNRIKRTLNAMDILLLDHVIITKNKITSFILQQIELDGKELIKDQNVKWGIYTMWSKKD